MRYVTLMRYVMVRRGNDDDSLLPWAPWKRTNATLWRNKFVSWGTVWKRCTARWWDAFTIQVPVGTLQSVRIRERWWDMIVLRYEGETMMTRSCAELRKSQRTWHRKRRCLTTLKSLRIPETWHVNKGISLCPEALYWKLQLQWDIYNLNTFAFFSWI